MSAIVLHAPFAGWLTPLEEVPDPVFAERMMGDGIAIDPVEPVLRSPADATVIAIPHTAHAVTLLLANGAELLIHLGLETVALGGAGFRALSSAGVRVKAGDPLIEFDLDGVARGARSLVTPIVVANEGYSLVLDRPSRSVRCGEAIGTLSGHGEAALDAAGEVHERAVTIDAGHGLHARPAARIAALLRPFAAEVKLKLGDKSANARSTVALLGLGVRQGDEVQIIARGMDSKAAADAIAGLIEGGLGEPETPAAASPAASNFGGPVCASPGIGIGKVVQFRAGDLPVPRDGAGVAEENERLAKAIDIAATSLVEGDPVAAELAAAHRTILEDPDLIAGAHSRIAEGRSAAFAWRAACETAREAIRATGDALLMERAADLLDIERRVIAALVGDDAASVPELPRDSILIAPDLLPSQFLALDKSRLAGVCMAQGGPTSHVAILAAAAGIPMIVSAGTGILEIADGTTAILDADQACIDFDPNPEALDATRVLLTEKNARRAAEARDAHEPCFTADGVRIEIFANLASIEDAQAAVAAGAEGCGLLRTEFLFLDRDAPPGEEEQCRVYSAIASVLGSRPLVIRTLDIGADKQVPYLAIGREENPALGLRGIRLTLARPDFLATQLRAILQAVPPSQCRIMMPMIADLEEIRQSRRMLEEAATATGLADRIALGIMVETPAAAILAGTFAAEADFLSVGTNDLTQYALAADRGNAAVSGSVDALHPAVLRLIRQAADGARQHGRWIGVCGGLASDPLAAGILVGLGITELSVAPAVVATIKGTVRRLHSAYGRELAERACAAASAQEVRAMAAQALAQCSS